eukprot:TRINITY_DN37414_c0_g1_i1.p1 TRINITY_DN37414_c0_g1~~TRINITY_DN37414_c0_g1_i1.p1  ORF type:complete len:509 (+),score=106.41 TRINITY_DN37414_c0_g1_i1:226-1527(+)
MTFAGTEAVVALAAAREAGWPFLQMVALHEQRLQKGAFTNQFRSFCPAVEVSGYYADQKRADAYLQEMRKIGVPDWSVSSSPFSAMTTDKKASEIALVFLLGCDETTPLHQVLIQVDALRTLKHSIQRFTTFLPAAYIVLTTKQMPDRARRILHACGFLLRQLPSPEVSFPGLEELKLMVQAGQSSEGWWWGWLKPFLGLLTEASWVLYLDSDMLAVGSLDPLMAAPSVLGNDVDLLATTEVDGDQINTGLMLMRIDERRGSKMLQRLTDEVKTALQHNVSFSSFHEQPLTDKILKSYGEDLGNALLSPEDRLLGCTEQMKTTRRSEIRFCRLPRKFQVALPTTSVGGKAVDPRVDATASFDTSEVARQRWLSRQPLVMLHFTGEFVNGKPWSKPVRQRSIWDDTWWKEHDLMCTGAEDRNEPPCSIKCKFNQ